MLWLSNTRVPQMVQFLKSIPSLFPRLLVHLPYVSPIFDILAKLVYADDPHPQLNIIPWLQSENLVSQVVALLDPVKAPIEAHIPAGEFLRGIIAAASAASASKQQQQQQQAAKFGEIDAGTLGLNGFNNNAWSNWPNNTLVRELASERTVKRLLSYMLDARPVTLQAPSRSIQESGLERQDTEELHELLSTPRGRSPYEATFKVLGASGQVSDLATGLMAVDPQDEPVLPSDIGMGNPDMKAVTPSSPPRSLSTDTKIPSAEAATSSLLNSLTLIIDLIRKNNSDFTELQILQYLERINSAGMNDNSGEEGGGEGEGEEIARQHQTMNQGPSLVDLGPLLVNITARLPELHQLLLYPRSSTVPVPTTLQGSTAQEPLTFERFRICELYAELLHCSNMAILNRPVRLPPLKDDIHAPTYDIHNGRIVGTRKEAYEQLSRALNAQLAPSPIQGFNASPSNGVDDEEQDDEGMVEDISLADDEVEAETDNRPVTGLSDATSSYTSGASDGIPLKEDAEDVLDFLNSAAEDLSLEVDGSTSKGQASASSSTNSSPMTPPSANSPAAKSPQMPSGSIAEAHPNFLSNGKRAPTLEKIDSQERNLQKEVFRGGALKKAFIDLQVVTAVLVRLFCRQL